MSNGYVINTGKESENNFKKLITFKRKHKHSTG